MRSSSAIRSSRCHLNIARRPCALDQVEFFSFSLQLAAPIDASMNMRRPELASVRPCLVIGEPIFEASGLSNIQRFPSVANNAGEDVIPWDIVPSRRNLIHRVCVLYATLTSPDCVHLVPLCGTALTVSSGGVDNA